MKNLMCWSSLLLLFSSDLSVVCSTARGANVEIDPVTRCPHISYQVPPAAGKEVIVLCCWSAVGANDWKPAKVRPLLSETALNMANGTESKRWVTEGRIVEHRAAGLERTVVFNPYPEAQVDGLVDIEFRVQAQTAGGKTLATEQVRIEADNTDVVYIEDWSGVLQKDLVEAKAKPAGRKWWWRTGLEASAGVTLGNGLYGTSGSDVPLPPLSYPLDLRGHYAVFVCTATGKGGIRLRMTGDERVDELWSRHTYQETLWRWCRMDRQHLVLKQPQRYTGWTPAHIDYVKFVPLPEELVDKLESSLGRTVDKIIAGYFEPYSWAFHEKVLETLQHREPLTAFRDARVALVDIQIGRFGDKVVYESRHTDPLLYSTIGDPIGKVVRPTTNNVGMMQQYTNTLDAELCYSNELGLQAYANFGASNCYPGTPLQGDFSKKHPEWMRGAQLRFEVPEVREYALRLYREALEIGAPGISIDFCRYPETIDKTETCNTFLRELRGLADEFSKARDKHVPILVHFPGKGVRLWNLFDYRTWIREGWVDYLCPSNIQARHHHIDVTPYVEAVRGTRCKLLAGVDGGCWGLPMPGPFLWRVAQLYDIGVDGIYVYQADWRVHYWIGDRRCMKMLVSSKAVRQWWDEDQRMRSKCSKGIYITGPHQFGVYHGWERLRVWLEGIAMREVEMYLDGKLVCRNNGPPYMLGTEDYTSDKVVPPGKHKLRIRAKDGNGWLEHVFTITGAK